MSLVIKPSGKQTEEVKIKFPCKDANELAVSMNRHSRVMADVKRSGSSSLATFDEESGESGESDDEAAEDGEDEKEDAAESNTVQGTDVSILFCKKYLGIKHAAAKTDEDSEESFSMEVSEVTPESEAYGKVEKGAKVVQVGSYFCAGEDSKDVRDIIEVCPSFYTCSAACAA
eukprot:SAG31_NODE_5869_length_2282_cov_1.382501_2_plen_173_part_00